MSDRQTPALSSAHTDRLAAIEGRLGKLETARVKFGDYFVEQTPGGVLVARHARTQHITTLASPS